MLEYYNQYKKETGRDVFVDKRVTFDFTYWLAKQLDDLKKVQKKLKEELTDTQEELNGLHDNDGRL